ncbi:hypothetical protein BM221_010764 [Beauveria bassiana]|uniref:Uncharacterized protein n=1 Tax=Beauveria bassiana TaxID=176275 RepID=A0A2N6N800_BEABA|nr:hypothetical protein BM221_010764 [Beauveria bassiana]
MSGTDLTETNLYRGGIAPSGNAEASAIVPLNYCPRTSLGLANNWATPVWKLDPPRSPLSSSHGC